MTQKSPSWHHPTTLSGYIFATKAVSAIEKQLVKQNIYSTCLYDMVNVGLLAAEIVSLVWGTPANLNGFRLLAALLHGTPVLGVSQSLRRWTEGATYIRQGGHHVGHWPTFIVCFHWKHNYVFLDSPEFTLSVFNGLVVRCHACMHAWQRNMY